ncbi:polyprenyl synthetase family protein [Streptomyces durmitorensis]|uniref:Polyprenyl synthetase family protein n=1 Tax=Streptomyces durmitorensis TaxID=319947 RepID=A0ABY4PJR8_9ACTN|nr:polyprenyl synthetase family protein [Streptomyces durmitorensis]UQT53918.1 polyprenyl synthetase family protein [Streptomyces durmitorensis]
MNSSSLSALERAAGHQQRFDVSFAKYFAELAGDLNGAQLGRFPPRCLELLAQLSLRGGKRIRIALLYEAAGLVTRDEVPGLAEAALSLELLHSHALILDDIMDDSPMRRGGPSTYYACREDLPNHPQAALGLAMMAGDLAGFLALRVLFRAELPADRKQAMIDVQLGVTTDTVIGQALDLERDVNSSADEELLETVCEYKTSRYTILAPLRLGLLAAGQDLAPHEQSLRRYARLAGLSGQMRDDYLDLFGDPAVTGKPEGADLRAGRHTYLTRELLALTSDDDHDTVKSALGNPDCTPRTIDRIRDIAHRHNVHTRLQKAIDHHAQAAAAEAGSWHRHWNDEAVTLFEQLPLWGARRKR